MALSLPYPNTPQNGQAGDATPINANFTALAQAIQSFDGSQIAAGTIVGSALNSTVNPITRDALLFRNFVSSGCIWSTVSGLQGTMSSGVLFINGNMVTVNGVVAQTFTASQDTYIDIDYNGNVYYQGVSNNASSPAITANSVRVAIVVTSGSAISSINQGSIAATAPVVSSVVLTVNDTLGNLIYPTDPMSKIIGYRQITTTFSTASTTDTQVTGLSCPVIVPTGRKVKISLQVRAAYNANANNQSIPSIWDGTVGSGTKLNEGYGQSNATANTGNSSSPFAIQTPNTNNKTYNAGLYANPGGTANWQAASTTPGIILVELV